MTEPTFAAATLERVLGGGDLTVAAAESCTGGLLASALVKIPGSGGWFRGGLVAYGAEVKFDLLGVRQGPVICESAAVQMAVGAARLIGADVGVATTGVTGPAEEEGVTVGTVFMAAATGDHVLCERLTFEGGPEQVRTAATAAALELLLTLVNAAKTNTAQTNTALVNTALGNTAPGNMERRPICG